MHELRQHVSKTCFIYELEQTNEWNEKKKKLRKRGRECSTTGNQNNTVPLRDNHTIYLIQIWKERVRDGDGKNWRECYENIMTVIAITKLNSFWNTISIEIRGVKYVVCILWEKWHIFTKCMSVCVCEHIHVSMCYCKNISSICLATVWHTNEFQ